MSYVAGTILVCLAVAVIIGLVHQTWVYLRGLQSVSGQPLLSRRQFALRLCMGVLLLVCIGMIFYAAIRRFTDPVQAVVYWTILMFLPLVVMILTWLDLRELSRTRHQRQAELYKGLAELQRQAQAKRESPDKGGDGS